MPSTWNGDVTFVAHDVTDEGFQVTSFADSIENARPFTEYGDYFAEYEGRGGLALPILTTSELNGLIMAFGGDGAADPLDEARPPYQPTAQSDSGAFGTGYTFTADSVFVLMGAHGLNQDGLPMSFAKLPATEAASVRARWVGFTFTFP